MQHEDVVLYGLGLSTFVRTARMALVEKGVPYKLETADFGSDALKQVHPFVKMPAFRHGDFHLWETAAIAEYVDEVFPGPALHPTTPRERAVMRQWISAASFYLYDSAITAIVLPFFTAKMAGQEPDMTAIHAAVPRLKQVLAIFDDGLADRPFFCGNMVSLADLFVYPGLFYLQMIPDLAAIVAETKHLGGFMERMGARESATATQPM